jgi:hypothetical protein
MGRHGQKRTRDFEYHATRFLDKKDEETVVIKQIGLLTLGSAISVKQNIKVIITSLSFPQFCSSNSTTRDNDYWAMSVFRNLTVPLVYLTTLWVTQAIQLGSDISIIPQVGSMSTPRFAVLHNIRMSFTPNSLSCGNAPESNNGMSFTPVAGLMGILPCLSAPEFGNDNSSTLEH